MGCKLVVECKRRAVSFSQVEITVGMDTAAEVEIRSGKITQIAI